MRAGIAVKTCLGFVLCDFVTLCDFVNFVNVGPGVAR